MTDAQRALLRELARLAFEAMERGDYAEPRTLPDPTAPKPDVPDEPRAA